MESRITRWVRPIHTISTEWGNMTYRDWMEKIPCQLPKENKYKIKSKQQRLTKRLYEVIALFQE